MRNWAVRDYGNRVGIWQLMDRPQSDQCAAADRDGPGAERAAIRATLGRIEAASGKRSLGWLGAGLAETWNTLGIARFRRVHPGLPSLIALKVTPNAPKTHPTETMASGRAIRSCGGAKARSASGACRPLPAAAR